MLWGTAAPAAAQYKNSAFELDLAGTFLTRPDVVDATGSRLPNSRLPNRMAYGERLGAEINFKLNEDHWWFIGHLNFALYHFADWGSPSGSDSFKYDTVAKESIGTILGLQAVPGIRYYFFTDRQRPYLQLGFSYMRLFNFSAQSGDSCTAAFCDSSGGSYSDVYLPHVNILALHVQPGMEFIVHRDLAVHLALDAQRWLIFNADGNYVFNILLGINFYS